MSKLSIELHYVIMPELKFLEGVIQPMKWILPLITMVVFACKPEPKIYDPQELVDQAIEAHGAQYKDKLVSFDFRDRRYSVLREEHKYTYTREWQDDSLGDVRDILVNSSKFTRLINGDTAAVTEEWAKKYGSSINSVLYFFQVPRILNDRGARKKYVGEFEFKGEKYLGVEVTFSQEGGGEDYEDVFLYWFHEDKKTVDYFAYSYATEGGGVRFREAINRRELKGLIVQDYINYKAEKGTSLASLPDLFQKGELEELSIISNERVKVKSARP